MTQRTLRELFEAGRLTNVLAEPIDQPLTEFLAEPATDERKTSMATWRVTTDDKDLNYRCDLCGKPADTVHFVKWITKCEEVLFACPDHDAGGYWTTLKRWFDPKERFPEHIADKGPEGLDALALLAERIDSLRKVTAPA